MNLYTDFDPFCCAWLEALVKAGELPPGDVLCADLRDITPDSVRHYTQRHWCCGIGGWPLALMLAGWPNDRQVDTCSVPCQPFSSAGKRKGMNDDRHLWPVFFRLVQDLKPSVIFGEQVCSADVIGKVGGQPHATDRPVWFDGVCLDLEAAHYTVGSVDLPAAGVGAPHIRQRLYWCARQLGDTDSARQRSRRGIEREPWGEVSTAGGTTDRLADTQHPESRLRDEQEPPSEQRRDRPAIDDDAGGLADLLSTRLEGRKGQPGDDGPQQQAAQRASCDAWSDSRPILCRDGKWRRIPVESEIQPLAHGLPNRVGTLRGAGNAICVQTAAEFIAAFLETEHQDLLTPCQ